MPNTTEISGFQVSVINPANICALSRNYATDRLLWKANTCCITYAAIYRQKIAMRCDEFLQTSFSGIQINKHNMQKDLYILSEV
jgi:hypothetical protein